MSTKEAKQMDKALFDFMKDHLSDRLCHLQSSMYLR